jgi:hypothetical protein
MYALLAPDSKRATTERQFADAYRNAAGTGTMVTISPRRVGRRRGDLMPVRMTVRTRLFGTLLETLEVPLEGSGSSARIRFTSFVTFPGLRPGERLTRHVQMPPRAALFTSDGTPLAKGPDRSTPIADVGIPRAPRSG